MSGGSGGSGGSTGGKFYSAQKRTPLKNAKFNVWVADVFAGGPSFRLAFRLASLQVQDFALRKISEFRGKNSSPDIGANGP